MHGSLPGLAAGRFGVIMFFSACRLPSFAPEDPPSHASENQITTGICQITQVGSDSSITLEQPTAHEIVGMLETKQESTGELVFRM